MKVNITSRKAIKPVSPTPVHLRQFHLSLVDQLTPNFYGLIVFFYDPPAGNDDVSERSLRLQNSLSQTLSFYYPMAGRLSGPASIDCNDEGAHYIEAHIDCDLSEFLARPETRILNQFLPTSDPKLAELAPNAILLVQFTAFRCGGTAISVCNCHKIGDAASLVTMLKSWTSISRELESEFVTKPEFVGGNLIPANESLPNVLPGNLPSGNWVTKGFVFSGSAIANLRSQIRASFTPSRVEAVLALIWKCASSSSKRKAQSVMLQAVNLRTRMQPPLPETSMGNLIWTVPVILEEEEEPNENEPQLHKMVGKMREAITQFCNEKANRFRGEEGFFEVIGSLKERREKMKDMETYRCTSWCKFPLYETDFGWGKPRWVSSAGLSFKNTIVMVDTKEGDGIESWVTLEEEDMAVFQLNHELLAYASCFLQP